MEFLDILKCYFKNESYEIKDFNSLAKISKEQNLCPLVYYVTKDKRFKSQYINFAVAQEEMFNLQNELTNELNKNNIKHIYFKGAVLARLYPDSALRTRGDIDIYVDYNDFSIAKDIMINLGYKEEVGQDCSHHVGLFKNGYEVELHFLLFDEGSLNLFTNYFKEPFRLSKNINNFEYKLDDTYHLIYCICHFAHHLRFGAGIRYIIDFYYMLKKTNIDYQLLHNELQKLDLSKLYNNILNVIYYLTNEKLDNIEIKDVNFFIDYMLKSGIHGFSEENNDGTIMEASRHKEKGHYFISRVFMTNKAYRISLYPKMGKHWYFYPICLIRHLFYLITHKMGAFFRFLFGKNAKKDIYDDIGI